MTIITISRGSYSWGKTVAQQVAGKLNYDCVGRELFLETAREFNIPEIRLERAIHDAPSILDRFTYGRERYIAYFQAAFLKYMRRDNVVYHGLAGHFFLRDVSHTLKIRIIAGMEDRVRLEMEREQISAREALDMLQKDDLERRKWSKALYGIDPMDANLYDLVLHIGKLGISDVVDVICQTTGLQAFQTTYESQKAIEDLSLAAEVKAALIDLKPDVLVTATNGTIEIGVSRLRVQDAELIGEMKSIAEKIPGVREAVVHNAHRAEWTE